VLLRCIASSAAALSVPAIARCVRANVQDVHHLRRELHYKETIPKIQNKYSQEKELRGQSQFSHLCVYERVIYSHDRSAYSAAGNVRTDPGNI
jgi:hypothetical protein